MQCPLSYDVTHSQVWDVDIFGGPFFSTHHSHQFLAMCSGWGLPWQCYDKLLLQNTVPVPSGSPVQFSSFWSKEMPLPQVPGTHPRTEHSLRTAQEPEQQRTDLCTHRHMQTHTQGGVNLREGFRLDCWLLLNALSASACPSLHESVCAHSVDLQL